MQKQSTYNTYEIIRKCREAGVEIEADNGQIRTTGLNLEVHSELVSELKTNRDAIIDYLNREKQLKSSHADGLKTLTASDFPWCDISEAFLDSPLVQSVNTENLYIAAPMQAGLIFHGLMDNGGASYTSITFGDLIGELNKDAFFKAWQYITDRYEIFRTSFVGMAEKQIHQLVQKNVQVFVSELDWCGRNEQQQQQDLDALYKAEKEKGFDFSLAPLMRVTLVKLNEDKYHFVWSHHHVLLDGWCLPIVFREVLAAYEAFTHKHEPKLQPVAPYVGYISWLYKQDKVKARSFWQKKLGDISSPTHLAIDCLPGASEERAPRACHSVLSKSVTEKLVDFAKHNTCTLNIVIQAAWTVLLQRYSNESTIIFGSTVSGRPAELPGIEKMIGLFINTLPVRVDFDKETTVKHLLNELQSNNVGSDEFSYLSLADIQKESQIPGGTKLFDSLIVFENYPTDLSTKNLQGVLGVEVANVKSEEQTNFALTLMARHQESLSFEIQYWSDTFSSEAVARLAQHLETILLDFVEGGAQKNVHNVKLLSKAELHHHVTEFNETSHDFQSDALLHEIIEHQVAATPDNPAVECEGRSLSYSQLNERANQLAHLLAQRGVKTGSLVGLFMTRSTDMLVSILAILKAGGAYVALDPDYPSTRLEYILDEAKITIVLSQKELISYLPKVSLTPLLVDSEEFEAQLSNCSTVNPKISDLDNKALCYVMFTSGSTGKPKGVMMAHQALVNRLEWMQRQYPLKSDDKVLQKTPYSFDVSVWELLWAVSVGAQVIFAKPDGHKDPQYLRGLIQTRGITTMHFVPSMLKVMLDSVDWKSCDSVRRVFCSGEALSHALVTQYFATGTRAELHNLYGPTEAAIDVTYWNCKDYQSVTSIPIGRPISNIQLYVLDKSLNVQPTGVLGELHIGGVGLAQGYLNRLDLTAERFINDPFSLNSGAKLYKTGDLVRMMPDGTLDYQGRLDSQVKVRGFRIELGEIEHQLTQLSSVSEAAVKCWGDGGDKRIVGYVVPTDKIVSEDKDAVLWLKREFASTVSEFLAEVLPAYMLPSEFVVLDAMPLNNNGKIDRHNLPAPDKTLLKVEKYVAPRNAREEQLTHLWQEVLQVEQVGIRDNFFALGGHSLIAVRLCALIQDRFKQSMPMRALIEAPTIEGVAKYLHEHQNDKFVESLPMITVDKENVNAPFPLTGVQQAYMIGRSDAFSLGNTAAHGYHEFNVAELNFDNLTKAWRRIIDRHGIMRAVFDLGGTQRILNEVPDYEIIYVDARNFSEQSRESLLQGIRDELSHKVYDVTQYPLFELRVTRIADAHYRLHYSMDLLLIDGSSARILRKEMAQLYFEPDMPLEPIDVTFRDYVLAEQAVQKSHAYQKARDYWVNRIETLPMAPALPLAKDPSLVKEPKFLRRKEIIDASRWLPFKDSINELGITPTVFLLTLYSQVLSRWSKSSSLTLNLTLFNRLPLHEQIEQLAGDFTSLVLLEIHAKSSESINDNAKRIQSQLWDDLEHRHFGGIEVMRELNRQMGSGQAASMPVIFTSALGLGSGDQNDKTKGNAFVQPKHLQDMNFGITQTSQIWLDHVAKEINGDLHLHWDSIEELFPVGLLNEMFATYIDLVTGIVSGQMTVDDKFSPKLIDSQQSVRDEVNATVVERDAETLHGMFIKAAARYPDNVAVINNEQKFSYKQIDTMAGDLSAQLTRLGARSNKPIAIVMEKGWEQVVAALGIMYSGAAYMPIDGSLPADRIQQLLEIGECEIIVTQPMFKAEVEWPENISVVSLTDRALVGGAQRFVAPYNPLDIAYVIFTSGSTGQPKGVVIDHRGAANTCIDINSKFDVCSHDKILALSALNFDLSVYDLFGFLAVGGAIVIPTAGRDKETKHWSELVARHGVTVWNTVPALAQLYFEQLEIEKNCSESLRLFLLSGDWLPLSLPDNLRTVCPNSTVVSLGGATEASIWSIYYRISSVDPEWKSIPYGKPLENQTFHVLRADLSASPQWVIGDLYIGGIGLAKGYWKDLAKTNASFITHPETGERLYKTGDLGRYLPDGNIEFMGREDSQVKVHGHRIELGEIEAVLAKHELVHDAVVLALGENRHNKRLVAYIQPKTSEHINDNTVLEQQLRTLVSAKLPSYMIPVMWIVVERMPLTPNGKVNRKGLPKPRDSEFQQNSYVAPRNNIETHLCEIWQAVLGVDRVGINDNFFSLGGHSLLAVRLGTQVKERLNRTLPLRQLLESPTIAGCALYLSEQEDDVNNDGLPIMVIDKSAQNDWFPLNGVQQAYFMGRSAVFSLGNVSAHDYSEMNMVDLDIQRVEDVWNRLIKYHGMLRSIFSSEGMQRIQDTVPHYSVEVEDMRHLPEVQKQVRLMEIRDELSHQVFEIDQWPLFEIRVSHISEHHYRLHFSMDLMLTDASSGRILATQAFALYHQPERQLPPMSLTFRDYVLAEQKIKNSSLYRKSNEYWLARIDTLPMAPTLPLIKEPREVTSPTFNRRQLRSGVEKWDKLKTQINKLGVTPTVFLMTLFTQVINRWSKNNQFTLNLTLFNRLPIHDEVNQIVGDFSSLTLLQIDADEKASFADNAHNIQSRLWEDLEHRYFGGIDMLRAMNSRTGGHENIGMPVVFTSALALSTGEDVDDEYVLFEKSRAALKSQDYGITQTSQVWLDHQVTEGRDGLVLIWDTIDELFPKGVLDEMFSAYTGLVESMMENIELWYDKYHSSLPACQSESRQAVNNTQVEQTEQTLHGLFIQQAAKTPDSVAIFNKEVAISYGRLDVLAGQYAKLLHDAGAKPNKLVAVVMNKGWQQIAAVLAVQYSGAAYLPIDGNLPQDRIEQLLSSGEVSLVLTQPELLDEISWPEELNVIPVVSDVQSEQRFVAKHNADDLAYVIFTSGSTGKPKGVVIDHRGAVNTCLDINRKFEVRPQDRVLALSALNFDLSVYDIFGVLAAGGALVIPDETREKDPAHWADLCERYEVTIWNTVPALAQLYIDQLQMLEKHASSLRIFLLSGDWLPLTLPDAIRGQCENADVISLGGATEASIWSIFYTIGEIDKAWRSIPYGKPLDNQTFHVLKSDLTDAPDWCVGDLYIGGIGLAKGYWKDEVRTNESFIIHPVTKQTLYKTGDLGRYMGDGNIEFLGREDSQVKVHGHRIELGEIESCLSKHELIRDAVVLAVGENRYNKSLVGYIQPEVIANKEFSGNSEFLVQDTENEFGLLENKQARQMFKAEQVGLRSFENHVLQLKLPGKLSTISELSLEHKPLDTKLSNDQDYQKPIAFDAFGAWMASLGQIQVEGHLIPKRFYPSAGSLYPVQTYCFIKAGAVQHVEQGFYYYDPAQHRLVQTWGGGDIEGLSGSFALFFVSDYSAMGPIYGQQTPRFSRIEAGHMMQLINATAAGKGIQISEFDVRDLSLGNLLRLENKHTFISAIQGCQTSIKTARQTLKWQARQSYRHFLSETVALSNLRNLCKHLPWSENVPQLFIHVKQGKVTQLESGFYQYCPHTQEFETISTDIGLKAIKESSLGENNHTAFTIYLVSKGDIAAGEVLAGAFGQVLDNLAPKFGLGLCAVGNLPFAGLGEQQSLHYCFEGGAISAEQAQQWNQSDDTKKVDFEKEVREYLQSKLPSYMVPSRYILIDKMPLNSNGKVNRKALPVPSDIDLMESLYVAPTNEVEAKICEIWANVLELEKVGVTDNFFEIGGNSLQAIKVMNQIRKEMVSSESELELIYFFRNPYPMKLAEALSAQRNFQTLIESEENIAFLAAEELEMGEL